MKLQSSYNQIISKMVQTIMQLRIDIKKQQTLRFKQCANNNKNTVVSKQPQILSLSTYLKNLVVQDMYNIKKKILFKGQMPNLHCKICIIFQLEGKHNKNILNLQSWVLDFVKLPIKNQTNATLDLQNEIEIQKVFSDLINLMIKLPLWQDFLSDNQKRKLIKKYYILNYKIQYKQPDILKFPAYSSKLQKIWLVQGFKIQLQLYYTNDYSNIENFPSQKACQKINNKTHKISEQSNQNSRKRSVYSYYDSELDIIFIASDQEIKMPQNHPNIEQITYQERVELQSDDQYELIIEDEYSFKSKQFKKSLGILRQKFNLIDQKLIFH